MGKDLGLPVLSLTPKQTSFPSDCRDRMVRHLGSRRAFSGWGWARRRHSRASQIKKEQKEPFAASQGGREAGRMAGNDANVIPLTIASSVSWADEGLPHRASLHHLRGLCKSFCKDLKQLICRAGIEISSQSEIRAAATWIHRNVEPGCHENPSVCALSESCTRNPVSICGTLYRVFEIQAFLPTSCARGLQWSTPRIRDLRVSIRDCARLRILDPQNRSA